MTAPQAIVHIGAKPKTNKKLFIVLGVVIVLVLAMKVLPSMMSVGGAVKKFQPSSIFHAHKPTPAATTNGNATVVVRPARDPFAPPALPGH
ncbi:MAG TPA: hypothetical protein VNY84_08275 [Acidimicrobiales bacterium]|nr:hypothetical protein [Acidimicrobiales bacterium]